MSNDSTPTPRAPKGAGTSPVEAEAVGELTVDVEFRGTTYTIDAATDDWDVETTLAFEEGKGVSALRGLLGADQFAAFLATKPKNRDANALGDLIAQKLGFKNAGE